MRRAIFALLAASLAGACARPLPPPGGEQDRTPPQLVSTEPAQLAVVEGWTEPVVFKFAERISERGITDEIALVSPDTMPVEVGHSGDEIRVRPKGGWQPGRIYQIVLQPGFSDLFGNPRKEPVELVFSTGPEIPETVVAGLVKDRISGSPVSGARIEARQDGTLPLTYATVSDSAGFYALRHIPAGEYAITIFQDQNRNGKPDGREARAELSATLASPKDTSILNELAILPRDTTPARLTKAEVRDSTQVRLTIDDYLDPLRPLAAQAEVWRLPDSTRIPVARLYYPKDFEATRPRPAPAKPDSVPPDSARPAPPPEETPPEPADTVRLPVQELVLVTTAPLPPKTRLRVTLTNLTNINGIAGGGGSVTTETPAAPPAAAAPAAPARPDSAAAARDTTRAAPPQSTPPPARDTTRPPPPDTTAPPAPAVPPDTTQAAPPVPPDTAQGTPRVPPDTTPAAARASSRPAARPGRS